MSEHTVEHKSETKMTLRELARQEIDKQVQEYLARGGEIETIAQPQRNGKTVGKAWRPIYAGSFE